ncbi:YqaI family protein [Peribacillus loiseleuriae]|uniref:YqaI family protein n=1 Tax=Peribacillus loiseleuriae TaxID=1679170 RepID=UPI003D067E5C
MPKEHIEHPDITQALKTGYPNMIAQPEHFGTDIMDTEILTGDRYIELPGGELLLERNIEDYQIEHLGWIFKIAD